MRLAGPAMIDPPRVERGGIAEVRHQVGGLAEGALDQLARPAPLSFIALDLAVATGSGPRASPPPRPPGSAAAGPACRCRRGRWRPRAIHLGRAHGRVDHRHRRLRVAARVRGSALPISVTSCPSAPGLVDAVHRIVRVVARVVVRARAEDRAVHVGERRRRRARCGCRAASRCRAWKTSPSSGSTISGIRDRRDGTAAGRGVHVAVDGEAGRAGRPGRRPARSSRRCWRRRARSNTTKGMRLPSATPTPQSSACARASARAEQPEQRGPDHHGRAGEEALRQELAARDRTRVVRVPERRRCLLRVSSLAHGVLARASR